MALLARGFDDVLLDHLVTIAEAYAAEQVALDPTVGFAVARDRLVAPSEDELKASPLVIFTVDSVSPSNSATLQLEAGTVTVWADLYTGAREADDDEPWDGDARAMARLYYLKEQVKAALFNLGKRDLGFGMGGIGTKRWPRFQVFPADQKAETWFVAGRLTFDVDFVWAPESPQGVALEEISVDSGRWSGLYTY